MAARLERGAKKIFVPIARSTGSTRFKRLFTKSKRFFAGNENGFASREHDIDSGENDIGSGENNIGAGENNIGAGENNIVTGENNIEAGKNEFGTRENSFSSIENSFDPRENKFAPREHGLDRPDNAFDPHGPPGLAACAIARRLPSAAAAVFERPNSALGIATAVIFAAVAAGQHDLESYGVARGARPCHAI